ESSAPKAPIEPNRFIQLTDTGGLGIYVAEGKRFDDVGADLSRLNTSIEKQIGQAIEAADVIVFVVDAQTELTKLDRSVADLVRSRNAASKVILVANKTDSVKWEAHAAEFASLGFGAPLCVSASKGYGMKKLRAELWTRAEGFVESPKKRTEGDAANADITASSKPAYADVQVAIVGKRNAGKSSLINAWAGEDRVIVSEIAGTTRDAVDVRFEIEGKSVLAIDTAGLRKRKSFADDVELYAFDRMRGAIKRAEVIMLLIDASVPISQVDKHLAKELVDSFKPTIIAVTKSDVLDQRDVSADDYQEYLTKQLPGLEFAPIVFISAHKKRGMSELLAMALNLKAQSRHRESTGRINAAIQKIMAKRGPGLKAKVLYVTQVDINPPTIVLMVNDPMLFEGRYERYLLNSLREYLPYSEVPIRLKFQKRKRIGLDELKSRGGTVPQTMRRSTPKRTKYPKPPARRSASRPSDQRRKKR
ncbi:MAG TPA: ribosome biogenesis GTPase Der, partial [Phycisphaerales bacterium]|nr:ribosome biogenesis GTPase Der [Phycisphaerales bacterium]